MSGANPLTECGGNPPVWHTRRHDGQFQFSLYQRRLEFRWLRARFCFGRQGYGTSEYADDALRARAGLARRRTSGHEVLLWVNGVVAPLDQSTPLLPASRGLSYSQQLVATNNIGAVSWSLAVSGSLPPNLNLSASGAITGSATTNGTYAFSVKATDSGTPPTKTVSKTIRVGDPVVITSSPAMPDACLNQPYSFTPTSSAACLPVVWTFISNFGPVGFLPRRNLQRIPMEHRNIHRFGRGQ